MHLENFALGNYGILLSWQGHNLDLHSCFEFEALQYNPLHRQVELSWVCSPAQWASNTALPGLRLLFKNVSFFHVKERDSASPVAEDKLLQSVSFHPTEAREDFDSIYLQSSPTDDLTVFFQSEWGIKINAASAELVPLPASGANVCGAALCLLPG